MTIQIRFVAEDDEGSKIIRWGTHSDFSHAGAMLPDGRELGARESPVPKGVQMRAPDYAIFSLVKTVIVPTTEEQSETYYAFLNAQLGKPYDWKSIVGFVIDRNWRDTDAWFCSELVAAALENAKILNIVSQANRITPNDLFLVVNTIASSLY